MKITWIHHSSFAIELKESILLFDYFPRKEESQNQKETIKQKLEKLPSFPKDKHLYVFASHRHYDHYDKVIFELSKEYPDVSYILSYDIKPLVKGEVPKSIVYIGENKSMKIDDFTIETLHSTDEGVAFIVTSREGCFYHAGDLNWWYWESEPEDWNRQMEEDFKNQIHKIEGRMFDFAFLPLDDRQGSDAGLGFDYFMRHTKTKHAFPMHLNGPVSLIDKYKKEELTKPYQERIMALKEEGQQWEF